MKKNLIKNNNKKKTVQEGNLKNAALLGAGLTAGAIGGAHYHDDINNGIENVKQGVRDWANEPMLSDPQNERDWAIKAYCEDHGLDFYNEEDRMQAAEAVDNSNGTYNYYDPRYNDFNESRRYKTVRLTESELHRLIKRSVSQILREYKKY